jgi:Na+-driven multidrug efflux pump
MNITIINYSFGMGFGKAATILIGRYIGAGDSTEAKNYFNSLKITTIIVLTIAALSIYIFKN